MLRDRANLLCVALVGGGGDSGCSWVVEVAHQVVVAVAVAGSEGAVVAASSVGLECKVDTPAGTDNAADAAEPISEL